MKDWSDDPSHHEWMLLPRSYISLPTPWRIDPTHHERMLLPRSYISLPCKHQSKQSYVTNSANDTSRGALAGMRNSSMGPPHEGSIRRPITSRANALTIELHLASHPMKDWSDDQSHHERKLLAGSYISLPTPWRIDPTTHRTTSERSYHGATSRSPVNTNTNRAISPMTCKHQYKQSYLTDDL